MNFIRYLLSKQFRNQLLLLFFLSVFAYIGLSMWLKFTTNHEQKIQVPDLTKLQIEQVEMVLSELDLHFEIINSTNYNPSFPKRSVINQSPEIGSFVKEKRKIYLTLNPSKYADISIQEFYGKPKNEVIAQLRSVGFEIGEFSFVPDLGKNVVRKLTCKGKDLKKGSRLPKRSVIDIVLGDGKKR